jgi:hypothetical protein
VAERVSDATSYARLRAFLESDDVAGRRLTAEWLAGRLAIPLHTCAASLDQLATEGVVYRHYRGGEPPWFDVVPPARAAGLRRFLLGVMVIAFSLALAGTGAMLHHIFYFALGMALGLLIAFAWLDWELRTRL